MGGGVSGGDLGGGGCHHTHAHARARTHTYVNACIEIANGCRHGGIHVYHVYHV